MCTRKLSSFKERLLMSPNFACINENITFLCALCFHLLRVNVRLYNFECCVKFKENRKRLWYWVMILPTYKVLLYYPLCRVSLILSENAYMFQVLFVLPNFQGAKQCLMKAYRLKTARCDEVEKKLRIGKITFCSLWETKNTRTAHALLRG